MAELKDYPAIRELVKDIRELLADHEKTVKGEKDTVEIYRAQGAMGALERVIEMIEDDPDYRESGQE